MAVKRLRHLGWAVLRSAFLGLIVIASCAPILWTLLSSLKTDKEIFASAFALPAVPHVANYVKVFQSTPILQYYANSLIIALSTTLASLLVYGMAAYVLSRCRFRGRTLVSGVFSLTLLVPMTALLLPVYLVVTQLGLYNTKLGLILVYTALNMPVALFVMRGYFHTIPSELEEAACIDGAGFYRTYFGVIMPIARPGFAAAAVLSFLSAWNDFMYAFILTESADARTLPISLKYFHSAFVSHYGQFFAAATIIVIPTIVMYIIFQRQIETGLVAGSVKG